MAGNLNDAHVFRFSIDASATNYDFVCTRGWLVVDAVTSWNATTGGASFGIQRSASATPTVFNNLSSTDFTTDTIDDIEYLADMDPVQRTFAAGDTMRAATVDGPVCDLFVEVIPNTWIAG